MIRTRWIGEGTAAALAGLAVVAVGTATPANAQAATAEMAPHRAIYDMSLGSVRSSGGQIRGVSGQMFFEWSDACDGWLTEQKLRITYTYTEGDVLTYHSDFSSWEAKDGQTYSFTSRELRNGVDEELLRGNAELDGEGAGTADYVNGEELTIDLPAGVLFPSEHTAEMIARAEAGERIYSAVIFNGSDDKVPVLVNTVIGRALEPSTDAHPLVAGPGWRMRMAFFPENDSQASEPDYEIAVDLHDNGIISAMDIVFSDFTITTTLTEIEDMEAPDCG